MPTSAPGSGPTTITPAAAQAARDAALGKFRAKFVVTRENVLGKFKDTGVRVYEFESGLVRQKVGQSPQVYRWDRIAEVRQSSKAEYLNGAYTGTWFTYTITRDDGESMTISGAYYDPNRSRNADPNSTSSKYEALGRSVVLKVSNIQLPRALETLGKGESLTFGDITISAAGVQAAKQSVVPWPEITEVKVDKGYVRIKRANKVLALSNRPVARIPNFPLFMTLADALRRQG